MTGRVMGVQLLRADARSLPLAVDSVDLIVTSPPYFALRSYTDGGEHYAGQIGSEGSPAEWLAALLDVTRECMRVLKPAGSLWVNLGDKYAAGHGGSSTEGKGANINVGHKASPNFRERPDLGARAPAPASWGRRDATGRAIVPGFRPKTLMGMPWRYALACIDQLGLILRAEVIWSKPNGLPESVTDRVRRSHEQWFHFTLNPRYYSAVDEIREGYAPGTAARYATGYNPRAIDNARPTVGTKLGGDTFDQNALGKLPGSVWTIPTQPLNVPAELGIDHFAAFPMEWPRRIIQAWSPAGICTACGQGRRPVIERTPMRWRPGPSAAQYTAPGASRCAASGTMLAPAQTTIIGETCACPEPAAPTRPAVVLDPFGGTGTTALVAHTLGRHGISVDMSADYCRLALWRTTDPAQIAAAMNVEKPEPQTAGQLDLFTTHERTQP